MIPQLALIALATFASEDFTCITAGVLVAQGRLNFALATAACLVGIFVGDILLFLTGRLAGMTALRWHPMAALLPAERVEHASKWLSTRGLAVVMLSRFTPGLRLPTYFAAGLLKTRAWQFVGHFLIAAAIWTPLLVGASALFGEGALKAVFAHRDQSIIAFALILGAAILLHWLIKPLFGFTGRRRVAGFLMRKIRWEFWPPWAAYLPLIPYFIYLACRHRSLTLFTAANPGIPSGGLAGESKSQILANLESAGGAIADYALIRSGLTPAMRIGEAQRFIRQNNLSFPVVLKPDVGERGTDVAVVRSTAELEAYLQACAGGTIIQRYVEGAEFGVFYFRYPNESRGHIFSITEKRFPRVVGDGRSTIEHLILSDSRAVCMIDAYRETARRALNDIPAKGEAVQLVELGSHCRGAVFLNGGHLKTTALEKSIDRISKAHTGFFFGRFDIRTPSIQHLQNGEFQVIELNGVSAEATHIYDPSVSLLEAYRTMFRQWRIAFEIGAMNRDRGIVPMPLADLAATLVGRFHNPTPRQAVNIPETTDGRGSRQAT